MRGSMADQGKRRWKGTDAWRKRSDRRLRSGGRRTRRLAGAAAPAQVQGRREANDESAVKALELACPGLAAALQPEPQVPPAVPLERSATHLRQIHSQQQRLRSQILANARVGA